MELLEQLFYRYNPWWEERYSPNYIDLFPRLTLLTLLKENLNSSQIVFVTGLRRVGKTSLFTMFINYITHPVKSNDIDIPVKNVFYISLDDYLISKQSIIELIEEYRKIHKLPFEEKIYLFLDEVTYKKDFEIQLKNIHDLHNAKIYACSSSASLLKSKKAYLIGRTKVIEIPPLSFEEYLTFKDIHIEKKDHHLMERYFEDYLFIGGIPHYVIKGDSEYLKELVDDIIYKDIAAFHNIKHPHILKDFFLLLMERVGKAASINKIAHILNLSPDTVKRYLQLFADTYLIYFVPRCGTTNEHILSPKKIYAADTGIKTLFTGVRDKGSLFENYIYLQIRQKKPCYIYDNKNEIDFFTEDKLLLEVKYHSQITGKQEALFKKTKAKKKYVITSIYDLEKITL